MLWPRDKGLCLRVDEDEEEEGGDQCVVKKTVTAKQHIWFNNSGLWFTLWHVFTAAACIAPNETKANYVSLISKNM
jgi:uncharacterized membrane protein YccF (DUF307 family)